MEEGSRPVPGEGTMGSLISACGLECHTCEFFGKNCEGCHAVKGRPFWTAEHMGGNPCPLYACAVEERGLKDCGHCAELPCKKFHDLKDPRTSDEEHRKGIEKRVALLRKTGVN